MPDLPNYSNVSDHHTWSELVLAEFHPDFTREEITLASGANVAGSPLLPCTLLGKVTASGKYIPLAPAASDGSENVAGILYTPDIDAASADKQCLAAVNGDMIINWDKVVLVNALDAGQVATAKSQLLALRIKAR